MVPTFWDVRRMSPKRVPLGLRPGEAVDVSCGGSVWMLLLWSSPLPGLELRRSRLLLLLDDGEDAVVIAEGLYFSVDVGLEAEAEVGWEGPDSLKIWTVSVAEETQRREEEVLKDML